MVWYGVFFPMINTDPLLSVVMPVYNERTTIDAIVRRVLALALRIELTLATNVLYNTMLTDMETCTR